MTTNPSPESPYQPGVQINPGQAEARRRLESRFKGGASWFFWVAALSIINTVIVLAGGHWGFIFGLGVTQIVDGVALAVADGAQGPATSAQMVGFAINLVIAGCVVLFGVLAQRRQSWAFVVGMVLYAMDGVLLLAAGDWLGAAFHGWVLFGLANGLRALRKLSELDAAAGGAQRAA